MAKQKKLYEDLSFDDLKDWAGDKIVGRAYGYKKQVADLCRTADGSLLAWVPRSVRSPRMPLDSVVRQSLSELRRTRPLFPGCAVLAAPQRSRWQPYPIPSSTWQAWLLVRFLASVFEPLGPRQPVPTEPVHKWRGVELLDVEHAGTAPHPGDHQ